MADPLHKPGAPDAHWSTDNVGEALPGVATPLGWTIWESASDRMCRDLSFALGVFDRSEHAGPLAGEDPLIQIFFGRIAMRMEWLGTVGDRMPGTTGEEAISGMLGRVPETMSFNPTRARYPVVAWKLPLAAIRSPRRIRSLGAETDRWWREQIPGLRTAGAEQVRAVLADATARFRQTMTLHGIGLFAVVNPLIQMLTSLVERTGVGDVGSLSGTGGAEMAIVEDIWRASRGQLALETVVANHGYHGPREGEISSRVWREDPEPLWRMVSVYSGRDEAEDPVQHDAEARERLPRLQAELAAALPAAQRPAVRALLRHAARTIPLRGVGKASFLQALDVARAAARRVGELEAAAGALDEPDDIFYLTLQEISGPLPGDAKELVADRRRCGAEYEALRLPASWRGTPVPEPVPEAAENASEPITGIGASAGIVEGIVRIVDDPSFADVEEGEVLVSHTTDPSWASIMFVSAALVVDIGGMISHAAVVARELGIPCVVNTRCGTDQLRDGDRVRVDGGQGTVELLERAAPAAPA